MNRYRRRNEINYRHPSDALILRSILVCLVILGGLVFWFLMIWFGTGE